MAAWLNYHHLFYFKAIAEEGSVSKAAEKLRLGQPTLSSQLRQFEENLGVSLFERQHKKLVLTEQGRIALDYARNIFRMGSEMQEVLLDRMRPQRPALAIGALDSIPKQLVLQLAKAAMKIGPCQISLLEGHPDELLRELTAHRIDLLLLNFVPSAMGAKGLQHRSVIKNGVAIYGAPKFRPLRQGFPHSLSNAPMILPTYDSKLRYDIDHWAGLKGISVDVAIESQDISVKKLMAAAGLGLLPAGAHSVAKLVQKGELVEIGPVDNTWEEVFLVTAKRKIENEAARRLAASFNP